MTDKDIQPTALSGSQGNSLSLKRDLDLVAHSVIIHEHTFPKKQPLLLLGLSIN